MDIESQPWLGIMTPFSSLHALTRSSQGFLRQSEELDELLSKIFKEEMQAGIMTKIQDDIIIGGETQAAAAQNYIRILHKLHLANLKIEPAKTNIFPESADIAGWIWRKGGYLDISPHRRNSLAVTPRSTTSLRPNTCAASWDYTRRYTQPHHPSPAS